MNYITNKKYFEEVLSTHKVDSCDVEFNIYDTVTIGMFEDENYIGYSKKSIYINQHSVNAVGNI